MSGTDTPYYPVFLDVSGKTCVVVGGGGVAERKVRILLRFNASVRVVSPRVTKALSRLAQRGVITIEEREYRENDLEGAALVFAATDVEEINGRIKEEARARNIPVNVVDNPRLCDFIVPSMVRKGPIVIAISTSGTSPFLAKKLRKLIAREIGDDYIKYAAIVGKIRKHLMETEKDKEKRKSLLAALGEMEMEEVNRMGFRAVRARLLASRG